MENIVFVLISAIISLGASAFGIKKLFRKKIPLYFQLLVMAAVCFSLEMLFTLVGELTEIYDPILNLGMTGSFGCNFFLLSANYGQLDSIIDDNSQNNRMARNVAIIAPVLCAAAIASVFITFANQNLATAIILVLVLLPSCPASYFNLKHLLLPVDPFGFLEGTKTCNIIALAFYVLNILYALSVSMDDAMLNGCISILLAISMGALVLSAVKGVKQWTVSV